MLYESRTIVDCEWRRSELMVDQEMRLAHRRRFWRRIASRASMLFFLAMAISGLVLVYSAEVTVDAATVRSVR